jgi:hypothetical protein
MFSFFRYDRKKMFWLNQKRTTGYRDPCETETNVVDTSSYDNDCQDCTYLPSTHTEVKCTKNNLMGQASCKYGVVGNCFDIEAKMKVLKFFPNGHADTHEFFLKVGCACHLVPE